jgi:5-methylcytosine-specific restriction protein A
VHEASPYCNIVANHFGIPFYSPQLQFDETLDNVFNIFSMCPNCHRAIHYSTPEHKRELLNILYRKREKLQAYDFSVITELYNCTAPEE